MHLSKVFISGNSSIENIKERWGQMDEQSREWYVKEIIRMLNETDGDYIRKIYLILKHHKEKRGVHNGKTQN